MQLHLQDPEYPTALRSLPNPPEVLTTSGRLESQRAVAIVGSRAASEASSKFAYELAFKLAKAGIIVVSGGALGIDAAAHRGAIAAGGATWVVSPTGKNRVYPPQHRELFAEIAQSERSRMLWSFADDQSQTRETLRYRNGVLAALTETLVVVQARFQSGSRNAAAWARAMNRPVWAVTAAPWMSEFSGSLCEIERATARPLCSAAQLFQALEVPIPEDRLPGEAQQAIQTSLALKKAHLSRPTELPPNDGWSSEEKSIFSRLLAKPIHIDEIAARAGLPAGPAITALLTLSLKNVVVEGPDGFFRRRS